MEAAEIYATGEKFYEVERAAKNGETITLMTFGWLDGFIVKLDEPFPNMDYDDRLKLTITIEREHGEPPASFTVQRVSTSVGPLGEGHWPGDDRLL